METVKIDKNSWHYRLIDSTIGFRYGPNHMDTCAYVRRFFAAMISTIVVGCGMIALMIAVAVFIPYGLGSSFLSDWNMFVQYLLGVLIILVVTAICGGVLVAYDFIFGKIAKIRQARMTTMVKEYGKICRKVEIVDGKG